MRQICVEGGASNPPLQLAARFKQCRNMTQKTPKSKFI
jgi:hypothetical protein